MNRCVCVFLGRSRKYMTKHTWHKRKKSQTPYNIRQIIHISFTGHAIKHIHHISGCFCLYFLFFRFPFWFGYIWMNYTPHSFVRTKTSAFCCCCGKHYMFMRLILAVLMCKYKQFLAMYVNQSYFWTQHNNLMWASTKTNIILCKLLYNVRRIVGGSTLKNIVE